MTPTSHDHKSKSFNQSFSFSCHTKRSKCFITTFFIFLLLLLQIETLKSYFASSSSSFSWPLFQRPSFENDPSPCQETATELNRTRAILRGLITFLPLKDLNFADRPQSGHTWFMSAMNDTFEGDDSQHLYFPSEASSRRLLCLAARDVSDGARNSYGLAWREALPPNATLLPGLTFVSDTYYDYGNLWHGLSAVLPFASWHGRKLCMTPERWVLFHWGELRTGMGDWVRNISEAAIGKVRIEDLREYGEGPTCFEQAVVFRHNEGAMKKMRRREVYSMIRCKARAYCGVHSDVGDRKRVRMSLLLRLGARSFKNESAVISIFRKECEKVEGCSVKVAWGNNMTFCDQVKMMSETDVLISPHGAQLTNLFLMDKNSSVMEFYPKGWKELAGVGQYVYRWMADWAGMRHQGAWRDPNGEDCPSPANKLECFTFHKDRPIDHDEAYFAEWAAKVLKETKEFKLSEATKSASIDLCPCI
ncbi:hypothetical protein Cni_G28773 [Canna indica]|uniref:Glycosyltransferase 61 catalytic domain-containing protein n=1 Tax=Canna indica TaxID=4628 RepID=A0AAQ3QP24_9LILI|nr:hypothetical protein Cni_G28773 [Canna indica]